MSESREIPLCNGLTTTVSLEDYADLCRHHWYPNKSGGKWYVLTHGIKTARGGPTMMHHIVPCPGRGGQVIHRDGNTLRNTRDNLVRGTHEDALHAQGLSRRNTSGYKGVSMSPGGRWRASICVGGVRVHLGTFDDPVGAATAYDEAAMRHFGIFARLNFPVPGYACIRDGGDDG